jgi:hypothetical protein
MANKIDDAITSLAAQAEISNSWGDKEAFKDKFKEVSENLATTDLLVVTEELLTRHSRSLGDFNKLVGAVHNKLLKEEKSNSSFIGDALREKEEERMKLAAASKADEERQKEELESHRKYAIIAEFSNLPLAERLENSDIFRENISAADEEQTRGFTDEKMLDIRIEKKSLDAAKYFKIETPLNRKGLEDCRVIYKLENIISSTVVKGTANQEEKHEIKNLVSSLVKDDPELSKLVNKHIGKVVRDAFEANGIKVEKGIAQNLSDKLRNKDSLKDLKEGLKEKGLDLEVMVKKIRGGLSQSASASSPAPSAKGPSKSQGMGI